MESQNSLGKLLTSPLSPYYVLAIYIPSTYLPYYLTQTILVTPLHLQRHLERSQRRCAHLVRTLRMEVHFPLW